MSGSYKGMRKGIVDTFINIYIFIAIALDESSILVAIHFSMKNIYQSCDLGCADCSGAEQGRLHPITFFVY